MAPPTQEEFLIGQAWRLVLTELHSAAHTVGSQLPRWKNTTVLAQTSRLWYHKLCVRGCYAPQGKLLNF